MAQTRKTHSFLTPLLWMLAGVLVLASCGKEPAPEPKTPTQAGQRPATPLVVTTFYPTADFAQRIGGSFVIVDTPFPPDADPATWQPSDEDIERFQDADLIIVNGAAYEQWLANTALPQTRICDVSANLPDPLITFKTTTHSHGPQGEHTHKGTDPHTWLDPINAMEQARTIADRLIALNPDRAETYRQNLESLINDLAGLDVLFKALAPQLRETTILASHPAYNYLARRYDFPIHNLGLDPQTPLTEDDLAQIEHALEHASPEAPRIMLWESPPLEETIELLEQRFNIRSVWFSPVETLSLGRQSAGQGFVSMMHENLDRLEDALDG